MCRIAGIYRSVYTHLREDAEKMRDSMQRGGPDDAGLYIDSELPLALAHRRLALIDLSPAGHQPMSANEGQIQLIFNGEIYNFLELKDDLIQAGHHFSTRSDTEVILKAYEAYGTGCFAKFEGMFALALFDKRTRELILARDHAGIKPLYYHLSDHQLIFASEIRAFKAYDPHWPENPLWQQALLTFGHIPEPITTLKDVVPLEKGTMAIINLDNLKMKTERFHTFSFSSQITSEKHAVELVRSQLERSVKQHLISDAPIGLFLSGGIDSSLLTLLAHRYIPQHLKTLSIVFEEQGFSEEVYQQLIVERTGVQHHSFRVTRQQFGDSLPDIMEAMDQPSTDGINSYFICKYAREYGLTAVLSGIGADELFGGYESFRRTKAAEFIQKQPGVFANLASWLPHQKLKKVAFLQRKDLKAQYLFNRGFFSPNQVATMLKIDRRQVDKMLDYVLLDCLPPATNAQNKVSWMEVNLYMQNQLLKDTDYMSMWHSLEVRVPFLDKPLMETAFAIDPAVKFNEKLLKHLLIKAFEDILPAPIWQRKKMGFSFPFQQWMQQVISTSTEPVYEMNRKKFERHSINWSRYWATVLSVNKNILYKPTS